MENNDYRCKALSCLKMFHLLLHMDLCYCRLDFNFFIKNTIIISVGIAMELCAAASGN